QNCVIRRQKLILRSVFAAGEETRWRGISRPTLSGTKRPAGVNRQLLTVTSGPHGDLGVVVAVPGHFRHAEALVERLRAVRSAPARVPPGPGPGAPVRAT